MSESALYHGEVSLEFCKNNNIGDIDLAFAYEAIARAYMVIRNVDSMKEFLELALEAAEGISKNEDKEYFLSELNTIILEN